MLSAKYHYVFVIFTAARTGEYYGMPRSARSDTKINGSCKARARRARAPAPAAAGGGPATRSYGIMNNHDVT